LAQILSLAQLHQPAVVEAVVKLFQQMAAMAVQVAAHAMPLGQALLGLALLGKGMMAAQRGARQNMEAAVVGARHQLAQTVRVQMAAMVVLELHHLLVVHL
jgi:hypothetical protein